jgi:hypothetical protein
LPVKKRRAGNSYRYIAGPFILLTPLALELVIPNLAARFG